MVVLFIYHRGEACLLLCSLSPKKIYFLRGGGGWVYTGSYPYRGRKIDLKRAFNLERTPCSILGTMLRYDNNNRIIK